MFFVVGCFAAFFFFCYTTIMKEEMILFISDMPLFHRILIFLLTCWWHYLIIKINLLKQIQQKQKEYFDIFKSQHPTLGHLINIQYAKFLAVKASDITATISLIRYWVGLLVVLGMFFVLFIFPCN